MKLAEITSRENYLKDIFENLLKHEKSFRAGKLDVMDTFFKNLNDVHGKFTGHNGTGANGTGQPGPGTNRPGAPGSGKSKPEDPASK